VQGELIRRKYLHGCFEWETFCTIIIQKCNLLDKWTQVERTQTHR